MSVLAFALFFCATVESGGPLCTLTRSEDVEGGQVHAEDRGAVEGHLQPEAAQAGRVGELPLPRLGRETLEVVAKETAEDGDLIGEEEEPRVDAIEREEERRALVV